ncbi:MAG TPA: hypothetical protein VKA94_03930 [Hyphomicrobiales bacterium]|nr:hypothetical protein [Hyphomicrobiales bacterium]
MALIVCHVIAYIQILSAGYNLWGIDPRILVNLPFGRNTVLVGLFIVVQLLGLAGAILIIREKRLGYILSIVHHLLLLPALVVTGTGLVMLMDDRINLTLLFMSKPSGGDVGLYWSLGWGTVFQQVTRNVPNGSAYVGINLFALACAFQLWVGLDEMDAAKARLEREMRRRERQARRPQLAPPPPERYPQQQPNPQEQRTRPQQGARQPRRPPPRWEGY